MRIVMGASGHVGRVAAQALLRTGERLRVIGRSARRLAPLVEMGAEPAIGDLRDPVFATRSLRGATVVLTILPLQPDGRRLKEHCRQIGQSMVEALRKNSVSHVVNVSALGCDTAPNVGWLAALKEQEHRLNELRRSAVIHLRSTYHMENLLWSLPLIRKRRIMASPLRADLPFPIIAAGDVGRFAAERMERLDYGGHTAWELPGVADLTMCGMTKTIGKTINKPDLKYVQLSYSAAEDVYVSGGMHPEVAQARIAVERGMNEGVVFPRQPRKIDGSAATTFVAFAARLVSAYLEAPRELIG